MNHRIMLGALLALLTPVVLAQTTNCLVYPGGLVRCTEPQALGGPTPSTNCQVSGGMVRCSQPQGPQPIAPPPVPQPMPDYRAAQIPTPTTPVYQQPTTPGFGAGGMQALEEERQQRQQMQQPQAPVADVEPYSAPALPQPDGVLVKSVYCYSEISADLDRNMPSSRKAMSDPKTSKMEKAVIQQMVQEETARKERLAAYMRPRIEHVDNAPLAQAFKQGKADYNQAVVDALTCNQACPATGPENQTCNDSCNAKSSAWRRTHTCEGVGAAPKT